MDVNFQDSLYLVIFFMLTSLVLATLYIRERHKNSAK